MILWNLLADINFNSDTIFSLEKKHGAEIFYIPFPLFEKLFLWGWPK